MKPKFNVNHRIYTGEALNRLKKHIIWNLEVDIDSQLNIVSLIEIAKLPEIFMEAHSHLPLQEVIWNVMILLSSLRHADVIKIMSLHTNITKVPFIEALSGYLVKTYEWNRDHLDLEYLKDPLKPISPLSRTRKGLTKPNGTDITQENYFKILGKCLIIIHHALHKSLTPKIIDTGHLPFCPCASPTKTNTDISISSIFIRWKVAGERAHQPIFHCKSSVPILHEPNP